MPEPIDSRIRDLLAEADAAAAARDSRTLAAVYLELGRVFHEQATRRRAAALLAAPPASLPPPDSAPPEGAPAAPDDESSSTDEVEFMPDRPLFEANELDDHTEFPTDHHEGAPTTLDEVREWSRDPKSALGRGGALGALREFLVIADRPDSFDGLAVEASRLQWATGDLDARLGPLARDVQVALLGLLAARAHHVQERLETGVGPSLALDRLRRWQAARGLPVVAGLEADALPERGGWLEDATAWWELLEPPASDG